MSKHLTILPTGTCFEDMTLKFAEMIRDSKHRTNPNFFLVHGICLLETGEPYAHAWIELDGKAIHSGIRQDTGEKVAVIISVKRFHREMEVQEFTRYTLDAVVATAIKYGDIPPPWEPKYRELTKEGKSK